MSEEIVSRVRRMLLDSRISHGFFVHEPVYTSEQAAKVRGVDVRTGVKALVLKTYEHRFILALVRADKRADLEKIAELEGTKNVRLASPQEVFEVTGCEIGSVPPFGHLTTLKTYLDRDILENDEVNFNCGEHTKSISMKSQDLLKVINPVFV
jgi:Ala-tRNA(Pro) deacylase